MANARVLGIIAHYIHEIKVREAALKEKYFRKGIDDLDGLVGKEALYRELGKDFTAFQAKVIAETKIQADAADKKVQVLTAEAKAHSSQARQLEVLVNTAKARATLSEKKDEELKKWYQIPDADLLDLTWVVELQRLMRRYAQISHHKRHSITNKVVNYSVRAPFMLLGVGFFMTRPWGEADSWKDYRSWENTIFSQHSFKFNDDPIMSILRQTYLSTLNSKKARSIIVSSSSSQVISGYGEVRQSYSNISNTPEFKNAKTRDKLNQVCSHYITNIDTHCRRLREITCFAKGIKDSRDSDFLNSINSRGKGSLFSNISTAFTDLQNRILEDREFKKTEVHLGEMQVLMERAAVVYHHKRYSKWNATINYMIRAPLLLFFGAGYFMTGPWGESDSWADYKKWGKSIFNEEDKDPASLLLRQTYQQTIKNRSEHYNDLRVIPVGFADAQEQEESRHVGGSAARVLNGEGAIPLPQTPPAVTRAP